MILVVVSTREPFTKIDDVLELKYQRIVKGLNSYTVCSTV
jgi:hypothetical protein